MHINTKLHFSTFHSPMYYFLSHLFPGHVLYPIIIPRMLYNLLANDKNISFGSCVVQIFISLSLGDTKFTLLAFIAYDQYMNGTWMLALWPGAVSVHSTIAILWEYGEKKLSTIFGCEVLAVQQLACSNTFSRDALMLGAGILILLTPFSWC
ncbi:hypothetical protein L345_11215, partial [Ophiophagus hannah]